jgi:type VI secretion system protein ImpA
MQSIDNHLNQEHIRNAFHHNTGMTIDELLSPISDEQPSGESLKSNGVYNKIKKARSADDPNLPMGVWQHNLKVADWDEVSNVALRALSGKSKDLQIAIWLLEAQIHKHGFAGIAPSIHLIIELCAKFWQDIHPQIEVDDDLDYRTNLIAWVNDKLQPIIKQLPITDSRNEIQYSWADWEMAIQVEQLSDQASNKKSQYVSTQSIFQSIAITPIEFYRDLHSNISNAIITIDSFSGFLDDKCGEQAPSLNSFKTLLLEIRETLTAQVQPRNIMVMPADEIQKITETLESSQSISNNGDGNGSNDNNANTNSREKAYRQLAEAAEFLMKDDPHSPSPYLVFKAIEWGKLNTAELYQELFVEYQGQLNIFEMLGLDISKQ